MTDFARRLKQLRETAGLSQSELAQRAGMNRFGVAKLEQGVREPSWATVQALTKALGVNCLAFSEDATAAPSSPTPPATPSTPPAGDLEASAKGESAADQEAKKRRQAAADQRARRPKRRKKAE